MSSRLYYTDSYTRSFTARIVERLNVNGQPAAILSETYFYATSGGQPNDTGRIGTAGVIDVTTRDSDGAVLHILDGEIQEDTAQAEINWARRFDHMQQHTGQHILSQAFERILRAPTVGFHLSDSTVTIDIDCALPSPESIFEVEDLANAIIFENRPVIARIVHQDDTADVRIRKLPAHLLTNGIRVIEIADFDLSACGGTHVRATGEVGMMKIVRTEKRGEKTRIEFRCGKRALQDYRIKNALINRLTADLTLGMEEIPDAFSRMQDQIKRLQRELKNANSQLADFEAVRLVQESPAHDGLRLVAKIYTDYEIDTLKLLAGKLITHDSVIALLGSSSGERASIVFARSANLSHDMNALLKAVLAPLGGRGGGQPTLAQGSATTSEAELAQAIHEAASQLISQ